MWLGSALGLQLLDQLLERQVLVGVGAERDLAHPAEQLAEGRVARQSSVRSTRVLTKKPISPSISAPVAVGDRRADDQIVAGPCSGGAASGRRRAGS